MLFGTSIETLSPPPPPPPPLPHPPPPPSQLGSPFRDPVMKFGLKFPKQTVEFFLCRLSDSSFSSPFHWFLEHKDGGPLRDALAAAPDKIISYTFAVQVCTLYMYLSEYCVSVNCSSKAVDYYYSVRTNYYYN